MYSPSRAFLRALPFGLAFLTVLRFRRYQTVSPADFLGFDACLQEFRSRGPFGEVKHYQSLSGPLATLLQACRNTVHIATWDLIDAAEVLDARGVG